VDGAVFCHADAGLATTITLVTEHPVPYDTMWVAVTACTALAYRQSATTPMVFGLGFL
jgi:hypothetical protein